MRRWTLVALSVLLIGGCSEEDEPAPPPSPSFNFFMTPEQFHEFGRLAGAPTPPLGTTAAQLLGIAPEEVQAEVQAICSDGTRPFPPATWPALPEDVPAYERVFFDFTLTCPDAASPRLLLIRARVANAMSRNELVRLDLNPPRSKVDVFCGFLNDNRDVTASLLANGLEAAEIIPAKSAGFAEIGIGLLIVHCPDLVEFLS